jgi:erythromycin esterase-like protein
MSIDFKSKFLKLIFSLIIIFASAIKSFSQNSNSKNTTLLTEAQLKEISLAIEPYNYVSIGETGHGDGTSQIMAAQIIEHLVTKLNFEVILFESDFYSLIKAEHEYGKTVAYDSAIIFNNLSNLFTNNLDTKDFIFKFLPSKVHDKTISIGGFDIWQFAKYAYTKMPFELDSLIKNSKISFSDSSEYYEFFIPYLENSIKYFRRNSLETNMRFLRDLDIVINQLSSLKNIPIEYILTLENIKACIQCIHSKEYVFGLNSIPEREYQMAKNSKYLVEERYKNKKVIFWGAAGHLTKNYLGEEPEMLSIFIDKSTPKVDVFSISFLSYKGKEFNIYDWEYKSFKAIHNSIEHELYKANNSETQLIFPKGEMLKTTYFSHHHYPSNMNMSKHFNLLIFIPEMKPINVRIK